MSAPSRRTFHVSPQRRSLLQALLRKEGVVARGPDATVGIPEERGVFPLSFAQERLWFFEQLEPGTAVYNVPAAIRLRGPLNPEALRRAVAEITTRHATLR